MTMEYVVDYASIATPVNTRNHSSGVVGITNVFAKYLGPACHLYLYGLMNYLAGII